MNRRTSQELGKYIGKENQGRPHGRRASELSPGGWLSSQAGFDLSIVMDPPLSR